MRAAAGGAVVLAATLAFAPPLHAQAVRGRVVDDLNLVPVSTARIVLVRERIDGVDTARVELGSAVSDTAGYFGLDVPEAGAYRLRVERLGYETALTRPLAVDRSEVVTVELWLRPDAVLLKPLVVTARSGRGRSEFYRRMEEWGKGVFLTPEMVDSLSPRHPADVLEAVEKVWVSWNMGDVSTGERRLVPSVKTYLGNGCMAYAVDGRPVSPPLSAAPRPGARTTVTAPDGVDAPWTRFPLDALEGRDIAAVEVYRYIGEAPAEFRNQAYRWDFGIPKMCGLTLFWTKQGW